MASWRAEVPPCCRRRTLPPRRNQLDQLRLSRCFFFLQVAESWVQYPFLNRRVTLRRGWAVFFGADSPQPLICSVPLPPPKYSLLFRPPPFPAACAKRLEGRPFARLGALEQRHRLGLSVGFSAFSFFFPSAVEHSCSVQGERSRFFHRGATRRASRFSLLFLPGSRGRWFRRISLHFFFFSRG